MFHNEHYYYPVVEYILVEYNIMIPNKSQSNIYYASQFSQKTT